MTYATTNPATGEVEARFDFITDTAIASALDEAHDFYERDWRERPFAERAKIISAAASIMRAESDRLAELIVREMGKLLPQAKGEVELSANILDYFAQHAADYLKPRPLPESPGATAYPLPLGVLVAVEPWNFPYYQLARVAGPQLIVGNVLIVKHASNVPQCAAAFEDVLRRAGLPAAGYRNVYATADQVGGLIDDPRVRGVTLTGSEGAGSAVASRAGHNLKKSVLELGGSDPLIVLEDAPFEPTLENVIWGRMNNTGQSCVASKRLIVVGKDRGKQFLDGVAEKMAALKAGDPMDPHTTLGPVSSESAVLGLVKQVEAAEAAGATVVTGGKRIDRPGFYMEATVVTDIEEKNPLYLQEAFGPVLSVYVVENEAEALKVANAIPFGLGGSVFTSDLERGERIARQIESGMAFVNHPTWTAPELPFGGVKNSGYGRELSQYGFGEFVNMKLVAVSPVGSPPPGVSAAG